VRVSFTLYDREPHVVVESSRAPPPVTTAWPKLVPLAV